MTKKEGTRMIVIWIIIIALLIMAIVVFVGYRNPSSYSPDDPLVAGGKVKCGCGSPPNAPTDQQKCGVTFSVGENCQTNSGQSGSCQLTGDIRPNGRKRCNCVQYVTSIGDGSNPDPFGSAG